MKFSIVICSYNPKPAVFSRLLEALLRFDRLSPEHEVIIVDNNSTSPLAENQAVQSFLAAKRHSTLMREKTSGLTAARLAGFARAQHDWVVLFDDDNEPARDYLQTAAAAIEQHPQVGAWGPGTIRVVYTENDDAWLEAKKVIFQERHCVTTVFATEQSWQPSYPFGTGLIVRKEIADTYAARVNAGRNTMTDRKEKSLASGGDVQLVLTAIEMGYSAGTIAGLCLNHLIDSSKANLPYMQRHQYGTASAYVKAHNQVFHDNRIAVGEVTNYGILKSIYSMYRIYRRGLTNADFKLLMATKMGEMNAAVLADEKRKPIFLKWYERMTNA
jgi:glycosyltransferase involved in cell wall biosynthesis